MAKTGAGRGLLGVVALERLQVQAAARFDATERGFIDDSEATGVDVVDTTADVVIATNLAFDGRISGGVVIAFPFVLERCGAFDPRASEFAFDDSAGRIALHASDGANRLGVGVDVAFVDDFVILITITIVQTFSVGDATSDFHLNLLAAGTSAVEPIFAGFEGVTDSDFPAVFHASSLDQFRASVDGFVAQINGVLFGDFLFLVDASAAIDATLGFGFRESAVLFACVEIRAIFPTFADSVFLTVRQAANEFVAQIVTLSLTPFTVLIISVVVAADRDTRQIFGDARFRHDLAALAEEDQTSAFDFGTFGVAARATGRCVGRESEGARSRQQYDNHRTDHFENFFLFNIERDVQRILSER